MNLSIEAPRLETAIRKVTRAIRQPEGKTSVHINENGIVSATDGTLTRRTKMKTKEEGTPRETRSPQGVWINADILRGLASTSNNDTTIEIEAGEKGMIGIKAGTLRARMNRQDPPHALKRSNKGKRKTTEPVEVTVRLEPTPLVTALGGAVAALTSTGTSPTQKLDAHIALIVEQTGLRLYATDRVAAYRALIPTLKHAGDDSEIRAKLQNESFRISKQAGEELAHMLCETAEPITIRWRGAWEHATMRVAFEDELWQTHREFFEGHDETNKAIDTIIEKKNAWRWCGALETWRDMCRMARAADADTIRLTQTPDGWCSQSNTGDFKYLIDDQGKGNTPEKALSLNLKRLERILARLPGDKLVLRAHTAESTALIIEPDDPQAANDGSQGTWMLARIIEKNE